MEKRLDLVAIGRSSVDLYGQQVGGRLEDMASFAKYVGGSPTNTAIGAARLGLKSALVTRVGADHMGRFIVEQLEREQVDVSGVEFDPQRLTALVILGIRDREQFPLIFYREDCADMALQPDDIDDDLIASAKAVLINGTHLSTGTVFEASLKAATLARESGGRVAFDIDYRPVLWGLTGRDLGENRFVMSSEVTERLRQVIRLCDLIVGTEEEIHILGGSSDTIEALKAIRRGSDALIVCKLGPQGCVAFDGDIPDDVDGGIMVPGFPVEVFNVLGAGDAFMAGFLSGWLRDRSIEDCCRFGNACGAIVVSRHGCAPAMPTAPELDYFLGQSSLPFRLRDDQELEHIHWSTNRRGVGGELSILAIDHRSQFDDLVAETGCSVSDVSRFKRLALDALDEVADGESGFGFLIDDQYGADVLAALADRPYWIGRPIEVPKSRPVEFAGHSDVGLELGQWPVNHVVKCLTFYHVDDPADLRDRQERQLMQLFAACRETGHECLMEIIAPPDMPVDDRSTARTLQRLYGLGIRPDWWKLEPDSSPAAWENIVEVIEDHDPRCRGVVLLGLSAPIDGLIASFEAAARFPLIKGFAVGRSIFHDVARDWLTGSVDDGAAVDIMADRLATLTGAWRTARSATGAAA